jgi:hypothetical protein
MPRAQGTRQKASRSRRSEFRIADLLTHGAKRIAHSNLGHVPSASLGHYATLSFVAIGGSQRSEDSSSKFKVQSLKLEVKMKGYYRLPFTVCRSPFTVYHLRFERFERIR